MYDMEALLRKVFKQIRNEVNEILDKELSRNEFTILRILSEQGPKKVTEFAPILEVSASHITAVTDALVEKEWITRIRSKEDRRIIRIHITECVFSCQRFLSSLLNSLINVASSSSE